MRQDVPGLSRAAGFVGASGNTAERRFGIRRTSASTLLDRLVDKLSWLLGSDPPRPPVASAVGIVCAVLSVLLRYAASPLIGDGEALLTAFPLLLVASLVAGGVGGWVCLVLCTLASWYLFIGEAFSFSFGPHEPEILGGTFCAGAFVIAISVLLRRAFREIVDLRATEKLMAGELEHRIKNTLALVLSISRQTFREGRTMPKALGDFEGRMIALSAAQDLTSGAKRRPAMIADVITLSLAPFCGDCVATRVEMTGEATTIAADLTVGLALVLHELATNSAKYGALSVEQGVVGLAWRPAEGSNKHLVLTWSESNGPAVTAPEREGFGTKLIHRIVTRTLRGTIAVEFRPSGVRAELSLPL